ncbi:hypothetical protein G7046_g6651 [Stylonectria norvegica]|nr:hypothetical protein G7046_g6651 [Stylonectria norvegica]
MDHPPSHPPHHPQYQSTQSQPQAQSHSQSQLQPHNSYPSQSNDPYSYSSSSPADHYPRDSIANTTDANTAANAASSSNFDASLVASQPQHHLQQHLQQPQTAGRFVEEWDATQRGTSLVEGHHGNNMQRSSSTHSAASFNAGDDHNLPARSNTLKKKNSLRRNGSLKRSGSRRSMRAGSVKSLALQSSSNDPDEARSAFHCPVPTSGNPTDLLTNRFQSWRKVLKDLIAYFREIQSHYEHKSKSLLKLANVSNNISAPTGFLASGGIDDALQFLRTYNKNAVLEANKAREIEEDVILALTGLRSDLQQKIKEIKNLSGDFKNSVEKEMDHTRKAVKILGDVLGKNEMDESLTTGKSDPYLLRLAVDRQVERQIDEENYLHQAYLNLESSGRELESIVVGEIQKAYNAYAGILKREADHSYSVIEELRDGPISMPKDHEWIHFVTHDDQFVDPNVQIRSADQIHYPGQDHESAQEIRAGLLERKSKYLKSYTAGWYVLSATHLHEFKSADKAQAPVMSLYLPEQKVGSHSSEGGSSNKFILKGRQTGSMHRGHTWVFRAESHDTMMAWYEDIKALTEKTPEERSQFVRSHSRSLSRSSRRSVSSDGLLDEDDEEPPFSAESEVYASPGSRQNDVTPRRSQAGGRFPSDIQVNAQRGLQAPHSPSSVSSGFQEHRTDSQPVAASGALPDSTLLAIGSHGSSENHLGYGGTDRTPMEEMPSHAAIANQKAHYDGVNPYTSEPIQPEEFQATETMNQEQNQEYFAPTTVAPGHQEHTPMLANIVDVNDQHTSSFNDQQRSSYNDHQQENRDINQYEGVDQVERSDSNEFERGRQMNSGYNYMSANVGGLSSAATGENTEPVVNHSREFAPVAVPEMEAAVPTKTYSIDDYEAPVRPTSNNLRTESVQTISNLHIPGQYPKGAPA